MDEIFLGDCIQHMGVEVPVGSVDVILTSPPYNTSRKGSCLENTKDGNIRYAGFDDCRPNAEYIAWTLDVFAGFDRVLKPNGVVLYNMSYGGENLDLMYLTLGALIERSGFRVADTIVWRKATAIPNNVSTNKLTRICEFVFVLCRKGECDTFIMNKRVRSQSRTGQLFYENIMNYVTAPNNDGSTAIHKATYSVELCRKLLAMYAPSGCVVYDSFMGLGTTAVACVRDKYHYMGSELSERYCAYAARRLRDERMEQSLF